WVEYLEDWMHLHFNASRDLTRKDDKPGAVQRIKKILVKP
ncbi:hypothetical protein HaLaN_15657, partial [Haematococcus lacustris]